MTQIARRLQLVDNPVVPGNAIFEPVVLLAADGTPAVGFTFESIPTGADVLLTGWASGSDGSIAATDTVNEAITKLDARTSSDPTAGDIVLTGFTAGTDTTAIAATDNVNEALAKLQNRILALETP